MKLEDSEGEDVAVPQEALQRLSWGRTVIPGLPVLKVVARGIAHAEGTHPVQVALRITRDADRESDMEHLILALSQQLAATVTVVYTGIFPPPVERPNGYGAWNPTRPCDGTHETS